MTDLTAPRLFCVGTHHKTGTIWMRRVFRAISRELDFLWQFVHRTTRLDRLPDQGRMILFNWSSKFPADLLARKNLPILHVIRDPRDVLISGMKYHQIAPAGGEEFLHRPSDTLGGKTYQEHICGLPNDIEKLTFEMRNKHRETLGEMRAWDYARPGNIELRYEDLIVDERCDLFERTLGGLGLTGNEIETGKQIFWKHSLFGGLRQKSGRDARIDLHIRSGSASQWARNLPRQVAEIYAHEHGDDLIALGYERDNTWLDRLDA